MKIKRILIYKEQNEFTDWDIVVSKEDYNKLLKRGQHETYDNFIRLQPYSIYVYITFEQNVSEELYNVYH